jgi:hypothetical protein
MVPLAMMAGLSLSEVILPVIAGIKNAAKPELQDNPFQNATALTFLVTLSLFMLIGTFNFGTQLAGSTLSEADRNAFDWIKGNTPAGSSFLVMTGENQIFCDSVQEWFPVITHRVDITTIQGNEWLPDKKFDRAVVLQTGVQNCLDGPSPLGCIVKYQLPFNYIYIDKQGTLKSSCRVISPISRGGNLINDLTANNQFQLVYQTEAVNIFKTVP